MILSSNIALTGCSFTRERGSSVCLRSRHPFQLAGLNGDHRPPCRRGKGRCRCGRRALGARHHLALPDDRATTVRGQGGGRGAAPRHLRRPRRPRDHRTARARRYAIVLLSRARSRGGARSHESGALQRAGAGCVYVKVFVRPLPGLATLFAALPPRVSARRRGRLHGALVAFLTRPLAFALRTADRLAPRFLSRTAIIEQGRSGQTRPSVARDVSSVGKKVRHPVADHSTSGTWDPIVTPWHLDEHIPAFPVPTSATETIWPALPARARSRPDEPAPRGGRRGGGRRPPGRWCSPATAQLPEEFWPVCSGVIRTWPWCGWTRTATSTTPEISISGYIGGMALAMLTDRTPELFGDALGLRPVADTNVVLADARDLDPAEGDALTASRCPARARRPGRDHLRPRRARPHAGVPAPRRRRHRQHASARRALPLRPRPLPHSDRGMPERPPAPPPTW